MNKSKIEKIAKTWLLNHDHCATHYKFWWNSFAGNYKFQACIEQESYGHIFSISTDGIVG